MSEKIDYGRLILAMNAALLGAVTANMRAAFIRREANDLQMRFVFYEAPSEDEIEEIGYIGTETLAHFQTETGSEHYEVVPRGRLDQGDNEVCVFRRKEESLE